MEDIKIKTLKNQNDQNDFPESDEYPPDTDSNYPNEDYSTPSITQDREISKTTQSSKAKIINQKKMHYKEKLIKLEKSGKKTN
jgi:hypothetical protein